MKHPASGQVLRQSVETIQSKILSACYVARRGVRLVELFSQIEESTNVQTDVVAVFAVSSYLTVWHFFVIL